MLRFFRQIRQRLLPIAIGTENRFTKYLLYALGEIILVVIGILIALQVNNWNEDRKMKAQERQVLQSLYTEISNNKTVLKECSEGIREQLDHTDTLQTYLGPDYPGLSKTRIADLFFYTAYVPYCNIVTDVLDELRSSGNLQLIRNVEIRQAISRWSRAIEVLQSEEVEWKRDFSTQYVPYTGKWISWDDLDYYSEMQEDPRYLPSRFDYDVNKMLQQFEYANVLNIQYWRMTRTRSFIDSLNIRTLALDSLISKELK